MTAGQFLNVDLEIESKVDLAPLAAELEPDATVLYCGPVPDGYLLTIETDSWSRASVGPDERVRDLCQIIEELSPAERQWWQSAYRREFDVGYDATTEHVAAHFALRADTLERITRLGARLAVTIYRAESASRDGKASGGGPSSSPS